MENAFSFSLTLDRTWLCSLKTSVGRNSLTLMSPGASGDGSPSDYNGVLSMANVWTLFNLIFLWMMAWTTAGEERVTISCWVENEDAVGSDVCVSMVVSVHSAQLVDGVDSSFRRSFPRKGRAEIMSLDSKSGWMVLCITNARSRRLIPILCLKPPSAISEERRWEYLLVLIDERIERRLFLRDDEAYH